MLPPNIPQHIMSKLIKRFERSKNPDQDIVVYGGDRGRELARKILEAGSNFEVNNLNAPDGSQYWILGVNGFDDDLQIGP